MSTKPPHIVTAALVLPIGVLEGEISAAAPIHAKETKAVDGRGVDLVLESDRGLKGEALAFGMQHEATTIDR